jgi:hypothetical protein
LASVKISELPAASTLSGSETVPVVQNGVTVGASVSLWSPVVNTDRAATVATLAALKALTTRPEVVIVETGQAKGLWQWELSSSTTADDALVVTPTSGTAGRYKRIYDGAIYAEWFGVSASASAATNVTALGAALDAVNSAGGGILVLPRGTCSLNAQIAKSFTAEVTIEGEGSEASALSWTNASGGFSLTYDTQTHAPIVRGVSLLTTQAGGGTALLITGPVLATAYSLGAYVDDVTIRGSAPATQYWTDGLHFVDCWNPVVENLTVKGKDESAKPTAMLSAIKYTRTQFPNIRSLIIQHVVDGLLQVGTTFGEGLNLSDFEMVGVDTGCNLTSWTSGSVAIAGISNGHINAFSKGLNLKNIVQGSYEGLTLYKVTGSAENFTGVNMVNCHDSKVDVGVFGVGTGLTSGGMAGISLTGTEHSKISARFDWWEGAGFGVVLGTDAGNNLIDDVVAGDQGSAINCVLFNSDAGANNTVANIRESTGTAVTNNATVQQQIEGNFRTTVADAAHTVTVNDLLVVYTSLSAARTVTLPAATTFTAGRRLVVIDESGSASATNTISLAPNGTDTIDGSNTTQVLINRPRGRLEVETNGSNGWYLLDCSVVHEATIGGDVALNNTGNFFDGPSAAQGTVGRWRASGSITVMDTAGAAACSAKLWDGTTTLAANPQNTQGANVAVQFSFSGYISAPAGNIRISAKDASSTSGLIQRNGTGTTKDSVLTVERVV